MANAIYRKGAEKILSGQINFVSDTFVVRMVKNTYAQNLTTDEFLSSAPAVTGTTDRTMTGTVVTGGVFDANDATFTAVPAGDVSEGVVIAKWTGVEATSPLLLYIDNIVGFPLTTNGGDVIIQWDNGAYRIVSL